MPRKRPLKVGVVLQPEDTLLREPPVPLTLEERRVFREAINSTAFKKALRNIRLAKPSAFTKDLNGPLGGTIANNRLHQIQGWEAFETALGMQALDKAPQTARPKESYIDESTIPPNS